MTTIDKLELPPAFPSGRIDYEASLDWSNLSAETKAAIWGRAEVDQASGVAWVSRRLSEGVVYVGATICFGRKVLDGHGCYCGGNHEGEFRMVDCEGSYARVDDAADA